MRYSITRRPGGRVQVHVLSSATDGRTTYMTSEHVGPFADAAAALAWQESRLGAPDPTALSPFRSALLDARTIPPHEWQPARAELTNVPA